MDNTKHKKHISKLMSLALRHRPEVIGISLDKQGWASVDELIKGINEKGLTLDRELLQQVVAGNDKQRFSFSEDQTMIRVNQGHSIDIDLQLSPAEPPAILYHGTAINHLPAIREHGLQRQSRQHVHLSDKPETAREVGMRHGKVVILKIDAGKLHAQGHLFYLSANKVWLTDAVPVEFITLPDIAGTSS